MNWCARSRSGRYYPVSFATRKASTVTSLLGGNSSTYRKVGKHKLRLSFSSRRLSRTRLLVHCQYDLPDLLVGFHVLMGLDHILEVECFGDFRPQLSGFYPGVNVEKDHVHRVVSLPRLTKSALIRRKEFHMRFTSTEYPPFLYKLQTILLLYQQLKRDHFSS